ncbi:MAG TPA: BON domain-containing protein [Stellaceae bacterium]|nr:BON domain-containing protein [Stellaceae bacterium]
MLKDLKVQKHVLEALDAAPDIHGDHLGVTVREGVVTISGHVRDDAEKYAIERAVRHVPGVRSIADVKVFAPLAMPDIEIEDKAQRVLSWDVTVPQEGVRASAADGIVTLTGEVDDLSQRVEAEIDVQKLPGVKGVANYIRVRRHVQPADILSRIRIEFEHAAERDASGITADVFGTTVVLNGEVRNANERLEAECAARATPGVATVDNRIKVIGVHAYEGER